MSVYVGIDVHRKRSQVAVVNEGGEVLANRNVPNGVEPILSVIGTLPAGTPAAYEAAFGWGWLLELLEDYGFEPHMVHPLQCKAIASARLVSGEREQGNRRSSPGRRSGPASRQCSRPSNHRARWAPEQRPESRRPLTIYFLRPTANFCRPKLRCAHEWGHFSAERRAASRNARAGV